MENNRAKLNLFPELEGLKGLGILIFLAYAFFQHLFPGGFIVANLFLFISGVTIFREFHLKFLKNGYLDQRDFYVKEYEKRFFPLLWTLTFAAVLSLFFSRFYDTNARMMTVTSLFMVNNLYQWSQGANFVQQGTTSSMWHHLWYLSLDFQMILLAPILFKTCYGWHKRPSLAINMLGIITFISMFLSVYLIGVGYSTSSVYFNPLARLSAFTLGGMLGVLIPIKWEPREASWEKRRIYEGISLILVLLMLILIAYMYGTGTSALQFGLSFSSLLFAGICLISLSPNTYLNRLSLWKPLGRLGNKAYYYYLWSVPVLALSQGHLTNAIPSYSLHQAFSLILLIGLAELTNILFGVRHLNLPFGQSFSRGGYKKAKILFSSEQGYWSLRLITIVYSGIILFGIGILIGFGSKGSVIDPDTLKANQEIISASQSMNATNPIVINNIEGLSQDAKLYANALEVTMIGDSVFLSAASQIKDVFPKAILDAEDDLSIYNSISHIQNLKNRDLLKSKVVVLLGSNSAFTKGQLKDFIEAVGLERTLYFMTGSAQLAWTYSNNANFQWAANEYGNVKIIDWSEYMKANPSQFADGVHPNATAALELAKVMAEALYNMR